MYPKHQYLLWEQKQPLTSFTSQLHVMQCLLFVLYLLQCFSSSDDHHLSIQCVRACFAPQYTEMQALIILDTSFLILRISSHTVQATHQNTKLAQFMEKAVCAWPGSQITRRTHGVACAVRTIETRNKCLFWSNYDVVTGNWHHPVSLY